MSFCTSCGKPVSGDDRYCPGCGTAQPSSAPVAAAVGRRCPLCRQTVDPGASRCPHCAGEIGRLQDCVQCPKCSEMVLPFNVAATNEKGWGTDAAKLALGGQYYLASTTEETYTACPACRTPIAYCPNCRKVTQAHLERKFVGVGRSKSGYQFKTSCASCSSKVSGPSCFVATAVLQTTLDATLLNLYQFRDRNLAHYIAGRVLVRVYYRCSPVLARSIAPHARLCRVLRVCLQTAVRLFIASRASQSSSNRVSMTQLIADSWINFGSWR
jgi:hypothetical protein